MLKLENIHKRYQMGETTVSALRGVSLTIEQGDFVAIMGPSGSGKSTLMHILGLLDIPSEGSYQVCGREVSQLSEDALAIFRRDVIGFIFQQFNLLPRMTALENVALPQLYSDGFINYEKAKEFLSQVHLDSRFHHKPNELSGGQQQRVAIARSLINHPLIILADEPTGNLDSTSEKEVLSVLKELNNSGITIIIVTHEESIGQQAHRIIRMRDGQIQSDQRSTPLKRSSLQQKAPNSQSESKTKLVIEHIYRHFQQGTKTLAANKVRTVLSMLGILIGVAAVVAMLALGRGAQNAIEEQLSSLGSNLLTLRAGAMRGPGGAMSEVGAGTRLSLEDAHAIKEHVDDIKDIGPNVNGRGQVTFQNKNWNTQVLGSSPSYSRIHASEPDLGRFFNEDEVTKRARVAVIGRTLVRELFANQSPIGEMIKINKVSFQIIGVLPEKGANGFRDQDDIILIPVTTAMHRLLGKDYIDSIDIEVTSAEKTETVQDQTLDLMLTRHRIPPSQQDDAYHIRNMADLQQALTESARIMTLLLSIIAAISLVVGGIGIMNIMLVSVTERTREIGLRKAVGARRTDILTQFLAESVVISLVGGSFGILLAWIVTLILSLVAGWATSISITSVLLAFFFSASIGIIFGIYPARKAALLPPIDALRYE